MQMLTEHFSFEELTRTGISHLQAINREQAQNYIAELKLLANALEEIRALIGGHPIKVNSGFRCSALNTAVGGTKSSSHMSGLAADITTPFMSAKKLFAHIKENPPKNTHKVILEKVGGAEWVHYSVKDGIKEAVFMKTDDGKNYELA